LQWRRPNTLLTVGLAVGFLWALVNNGFLGARMGVYRYGRVIEGLALSPGTIHQYPLYDALAMGIEMMVLAYLIGRIDSSGRTFVGIWADAKTRTRFGSACLSILAVIVIGNVVYLSVFAPHLATKLLHLQTVAPTEQLYPGIPNQPL
jgi:vacuolar-type H+-ATPase subunit I/STV1